ncbi:cell wall anchor protein [Pelomyxa schiedti]|nr:cell wall anchor protein [Pelomyxa schiedti]
MKGEERDTASKASKEKQEDKGNEATTTETKDVPRDDLCEICTKRPATLKCEECGMLCSKDSSKIHNAKRNRSHVVRSISPVVNPICEPSPPSTNSSTLCSFCSNPLSTQVSLDCGHNVCQSCFDICAAFSILQRPTSLSTSTTSSTSPETTVTCAKCFSKTHIPENLQLNTTDSLAIPHQGVLLCDECKGTSDEKPAMCACAVCECVLCDSCWLKVHSIKILCSHQKSPLSPVNAGKCSFHPTIKATHFCESENKLICMSCVLHHAGMRHQLSPVNTILANTTEKLKNIATTSQLHHDNFQASSLAVSKMVAKMKEDDAALRAKLGTLTTSLQTFLSQQKSKKSKEVLDLRREVDSCQSLITVYEELAQELTNVDTAKSSLSAVLSGHNRFLRLEELFREYNCASLAGQSDSLGDDSLPFCQFIEHVQSLCQEISPSPPPSQNINSPTSFDGQGVSVSSSCILEAPTPPTPTPSPPPLARPSHTKKTKRKRKSIPKPKPQAPVSSIPSIPTSKIANTDFCSTSRHNFVQAGHRILAWGNNSNKQLGVGNTATHMTSPQETSLLVGKTVKSIACGLSHTIALLEGGGLLSWGCNQHGQLGVGDFRDRDIPVSVSFTHLECNVTEVSCGKYHTLALMGNGDVYSWGHNKCGQLGLSNTLNMNFPQIVQCSSTNFSSISCGAFFSVAISSTGDLYSWGDNSTGQLGIGSKYKKSVPQLVAALQGKHVTDVTCGGWHTIAQLESGEVFLWGAIWDASTTDKEKALHNIFPQPVPFLTGKQVVTICCGGRHTIAVLDSGEFLSWGCNNCGQLGCGSSPKASQPLKISHMNGRHAVAVSCGASHTTVLLDTGEVIGWGKWAKGTPTVGLDKPFQFGPQHFANQLW